MTQPKQVTAEMICGLEQPHDAIHVPRDPTIIGVPLKAESIPAIISIV